jgi:large subunit ribosomal protein L4
MSAAPVTEAPVRGPRRKERPEPEVRTVVRRDAAGQPLARVTLAPEVFGLEPHRAVLHQVVTAQLAAARSGTQSTKTRAQVRGGGAKPYRQKGTGRARQGSTRAPQWVGGGVALGPKPRSYAQHTPKKMIRLALRSALSDRAAEERVALVGAFDWEEPRTKSAKASLAALGLEGRVLVVLGPDDVIAERSFGNLPQVQTVPTAELAAHDVVRHDWVLFTDDSLLAASGLEALESVELTEEERAALAPAEEETVEPEEAPAAEADEVSDDETADDETADQDEADDEGSGDETDEADEDEADEEPGDGETAETDELAEAETAERAESVDRDDPADDGEEA